MAKAIYQAVGRRKRSVARIFMTPGKGKIQINNRPFRDYLCRNTLATMVTQPLITTDQLEAYDISVNVYGGGLTGQAGAIRLGIARILNQVSDDFHPLLKSAGFLTRDSRQVERKKYGQPGARKRFQFSKR